RRWWIRWSRGVSRSESRDYITASCWKGGVGRKARSPFFAGGGRLRLKECRVVFLDIWQLSHFLSIPKGDCFVAVMDSDSINRRIHEGI
ncbi:MAG: hypothetical protein OEV73_05445, partial [Desulfobulbaceae bacterium]|nr:hypothetical protein [Desulfobulbaceae bacterium]